MSTVQYMFGRKKYQRPQAMLWANNPGQVVEDEDPESSTFGQYFYLPLGFEIGSFEYDVDSPYEFLILSDDNRQSLNVAPNRIESRDRMANGRMRSYHIADKLRINTGWDMLPSRSYALNPDFNAEGESPYRKNNSLEFTTDGGAGGVELLDWYNKYTGSFWVYLSYDKYTNFGSSGDDDRFANLNKYSQVLEVFFDSFDYSVERRGGSNFDFWNIGVSLEEA
jgi:hypothetical protein